MLPANKKLLLAPFLTCLSFPVEDYKKAVTITIKFRLDWRDDTVNLGINPKAERRFEL